MYIVYKLNNMIGYCTRSKSVIDRSKETQNLEKTNLTMCLPLKLLSFSYIIIYYIYQQVVAY